MPHPPANLFRPTPDRNAAGLRLENARRSIHPPHKFPWSQPPGDVFSAGLFKEKVAQKDVPQVNFFREAASELLYEENIAAFGRAFRSPVGFTSWYRNWHRHSFARHIHRGAWPGGRPSARLLSTPTGLSLRSGLSVCLCGAGAPRRGGRSPESLFWGRARLASLLGMGSSLALAASLNRHDARTSAFWTDRLWQ